MKMSLPRQCKLNALTGSLPISDCGICTCFGYGSSFTGITVTSSRSLTFPKLSLFDRIAFFLLVEDDVLALAFAEVARAIFADGLTG